MNDPSHDAARSTGIGAQVKCFLPLVKRFLPLVILVIGLGAFFASGLHKYVNFETVAQHSNALQEFVSQNLVEAALLYILIYAIATAFSLPVGAILTITGGWLFGTVLATICVIAGATSGACALFLAARSALGKVLRARAGGWVDKFKQGFQEGAFSYMLTLRLVPLFPFWLVNLVPAALGVSFSVFALATLIGMIPGIFVFASVGNGAASVLSQGGVPELGSILTLDVVIPLVGLAVLSLIPVVYRRFFAKKSQ